MEENVQRKFSRESIERSKKVGAEGLFFLKSWSIAVCECFVVGLVGEKSLVWHNGKGKIMCLLSVILLKSQSAIVE